MQPPLIAPSRADREARALVGDSLAMAVRALREHGCVVIADAVPAADIAYLRGRMAADLPRFLARRDAPFNWHRGNLQQAPPRDAGALLPSILLNGFACAVSRAVLGAAAINSHYTANTALPRSSARQPVHADYGHLLGAGPAAPPHGLIVNVPLVDMDASNGATELWPGSHRCVALRDGAAQLSIAPELVERRRARSPPLQARVRAGSILLRDVRLWHAGMPNPSAEARPLIAMIHWAPWWRPLEVIDLPAAARPLLESRIIRTSARFHAGGLDRGDPIDHLDHISLGTAHAYRP